MKPFAYLRDPVFLLGCVAYGLNRFVIAPRADQTFLGHYFNDLFLIPCALPVMMWWHRKLGLRRHDRPPEAQEVALHLVVWSFTCEWAGPLLFSGSTADAADVLAYAAGGLVAFCIWNRRLPWLRQMGA